MTTETIYVGDKVAIYTTQAFQDNNGVATDPTDVFFEVKTPALVETEYEYGVDGEVVKDGVGLYSLLLTMTLDGRYYYRIRGEGTIIAAFESSFEVAKTHF